MGIVVMKTISGQMTVRVKSEWKGNRFFADYTADFGGVNINDEKALTEQFDWLRRKIVAAVKAEKATHE